MGYEAWQLRWRESSHPSGFPSSTVRFKQHDGSNFALLDNSIYEKYIRAGNPNTPIEELRELAIDEVDNVRRRVGENQRTPVDVLLVLSIDDNPEVRIAVAENTTTPAHVIEKLILDDNVDVRYSLAENCTLPVEVISRLIEDPNPYVSHRAQQTLRVLQPTTISELTPRPFDQRSRQYRARL